MKVNLALLAIIAVLSLLLFFNPGQKSEVPIPLAKIDVPSVNKIQVTGKQNFTLEKIDGHWRLTQPFNVPANENRVEMLLKIPAATSTARYPVDQAQLDKFQLNPPAATLKLGEVTLDFGGSDPIQQQRYVKVGDTLHLAVDDFYHHLTATPADYVEKKLLPENANIQHIQLPGLQLSKDKDGKWTADPVQETAAPLYEMADAWGKARAYDVQAYVPPKDGKVPTETAVITLADGQRIAFLIQQRQPDAILVRPDWGLQFHLVESLSQQLLALKKPDKPAAAPAEVK